MTQSLKVEIRSLTMAGQTLMSNLSFEIEPGQVFSLMGQSGSGKSSLLAYIGGFMPASQKVDGALILGEQDLSAIPAENRGVGLMFQDSLLFPHMSVAANLMFGMPRAMKRGDKRQRAHQALADAGLEGFADRDPATLSGGQKARVALMRALVAEPKALLLDEPFSKLDQQLRASVRDFVFGTVKAKGIPTLLVTHDPEDAEATGGPLIEL